jgi:hypothetical protein
MKIRKTIVIHETIHSEGGGSAVAPVTRVAGIGLIENPLCGRFVENLDDLFQTGHDLGERLMSEMLAHLQNPAVSYGKAAIVGINGDLEQGHAMLHPMLGKAMRGPIGGGEALIPSAAKIASAGASLDIPLGHKDDAWSFDHFDAMTICVSDGPRPDEILMAIAISDGGRPVPRVGKARATK